MIGKSDLVILAISGTLLAIGIYRWQSSLQPVERPPIAVRAPAPQPAPSNAPLTANPAQDSGLQGTATSSADARQDIVSTTAESSAVNESASSASSGVNASDAGAGDVASGTPASDQSNGLYGTYIVEPGDNLTYIANILDTSVDTLRSLNDIDGTLIYVDQRLRYPLPAN